MEKNLNLDELLKKKMNAIRSNRKFYFGKEAGYFAGKLEDILHDISQISDPEEGLKWIVRFFKLDKYVFEHADDSNGFFGGIYAMDATDLFIRFARETKTKDKLIKILIELSEKNVYGASDELFDNLNQFLEKEHIEQLLEEMLAGERGITDEWEKFHWQVSISSVAYQLGDPVRYEQIKKTFHEVLPDSDYIDIATLYYQNNNPEKSLEYLKRLSPDETFHDRRIGNLLVKLYQKLGMQDELNELIINRFKNAPMQENYELLVKSLGEQKSSEIFQQQNQSRVNRTEYMIEDLYFFEEFALWDEMEGYIKIHQHEINGEYYQFLHPLARKLEDQKRYLPAIILYRRLLDGILNRSYYKGYSAAARHLKKLEELASKIDHWENVTSHQEYFHEIREKHKRKTAFWKKVEGI